MAADTRKGVPGFPMAALGAIKDENTRQVLDAVITGLNVRNGTTGTGDARFITAGELGAASGYRMVGGLPANGGASTLPSGRNPLTSVEINRIITELQASVINSPLFIDLGSRVNLINTAIVAEQTARISAVQTVANNLVIEANTRVAEAVTFATNLQAEATTRLGFDNVQGSAINAVRDITDNHVILINGLTTRTGANESTIVNLQSTTAAQSTNLTTLNTKTATAESNIQNLQTTTAAQAQSLLSLTTRTSSSESAINQLNTTTSTQATSIATLNTKTATDASNITNLQNTTATQATALIQLTTRTTNSESAITSLNTTTATQAQSLTSLSTRTGAAESTIGTLNTTTATQANSLTALTTRVANSEAAITSEQTTRASADNSITTSVNTQLSTTNANVSALQTSNTTLTNNVSSLTTSVTTLQSTTGTNTAAIAAEATTRSNADGLINAKWSIKQDVNGFVSGFGLISSANNSVPFSDFVIRADRMAIGSPSVPNGTKTITNLVRSGGIGTVYTSGAHGLVAGQKFFVSGEGTGTWNKVFTVYTVSGTYNFIFFVLCDGNEAATGTVAPGATLQLAQVTVPFIVYTTDQVMGDGTVIHPGVYMDYAMVKRLDGAYIHAGLLEATSLYTGSQYVDIDSKEDVPAVAVSSYYNPYILADSVVTDSTLCFYGPDNHAGNPYFQRIRQNIAGRKVAFTITATAGVDHFFGVYYRTNGGAWQHLYTMVEQQDSYGTATIVYNYLIDIAASTYVEFGVRGADTSGDGYSGSSDPKRYLYDLTVNVLAVNL